MNASLHIQAVNRDGNTFLGEVYNTPPFKIANITESRPSEQLDLMVMTASPGILDDDRYDIRINVGEHANLHLYTQSFQRLYHMKRGASQQLELRMESGSSFEYIPHPCVPHESSDFSSFSQLYLESGCRLVFGEILTCGRKQNGEVFSLTRYHNLTEIFINGKLVIRENLLIDPNLFDVQATGQLEGYSHQASLIFLDEKEDIRAAMETARELLKDEKEICFGISAAPVSGFIARILGQHAHQLHDCLKKIAEGLSSLNQDKVTGHAS